jgi:ATP/maltotriose-dependent transcriptional regulator MalT
MGAMAVTETGTALLERDEALDALDDALAAGGRLVLLAGEAGIGKTALLRRLCERHAKDARILWGDCDALFTPSPLGPLADIAAVTGGELETLVTADAPPHAVAAAVLDELARRHPAIVVLEDAHWADEATLDVLRLLARRIASVPALLVVSYRDDELEPSHPLRVALGDLLRRDVTARVRLVPLSPDGVAELAADHDVDAAALHRRTAGNPFFVTEALAAGGVELPATVRDAVLARVARLSAPARGVLDAAAIVPGTVGLPVLEALAGDAVEHLDECLSVGVLGATATGVTFRHELARAAVEAELPPYRRRELHRRALAAQPDADPARLAHHAEAAGDGDAVLRHARTAADRAAAAGAHREAAGQYARALRFAGELPPAERAELLERRSHQSFVADSPMEAAEDLRRALACHREVGDRRAEGNALRALSSIVWCPGLAPEAERAGVEAVELLEPLGPDRELAAAYANMASLAMNREDAAATFEWGERALTLARELGDRAIEVHALNSVGTVEFLLGGPDARAQGERSLELSLEAGLVDDALRAWGNIAWAAVRHRAYPLAERYLTDAIEYASDPILDLWWLHLLGYRARAELDLGRWDDATGTAALIVRNRKASPLPQILALTITGRVRARRGDPDPWSPLDEALAMAGPELQRTEPVAVARAEAAWLTGAPDRVAEETDHALDLAKAARAGWVVGELTAWRRRAGIEPERGLDLPEPYALELAGRAEAAAGAWTARGCPYEAALALAESHDAAAQRRAIDALHALGAGAAAAVVSRDLRRRGAAGLPRGPRPATRENPAQLTARELEVLTLIAGGLRNRDIAERLFVTPKTVSHHVSAILAKLGARTRGEAVAHAQRLRMLEP